MYSLVSAIAKTQSGSQRWQNVSIGSVTLQTLFATYSDIIATLSNSFLPSDVALDLSSIQAYAGSTLTFNQFLTQNGNTALPTTSTLPVINTQYVEYADAFHAGYQAQPINPQVSPTVPLPEGDEPWIALTKTGVDYALFGQSCLVTINGFYHWIDSDANGVYIRDGNASRMMSNSNQIGLHSFRKLGTLTYLDITADMIYKQTNDQALQNQAYIKVGQDLTNVTVMLVIGGYLHVLDDQTFKRVGSDLLMVDFNNYPLFDRYYESRKKIDLSSLPLTTTNRNPTQIDVQQFLGDANITALLTLSQSFIVLLDNTDIFVEREQVASAKLPNMYVSYKKPIWPLILGVGRVAEYWPTFENGRWSLTVSDGLRDNWMYNTNDPRDQISFGASAVPNCVAALSPAQFLQIGRDL